MRRHWVPVPTKSWMGMKEVFEGVSYIWVRRRRRGSREIFKVRRFADKLESII